MNEIHPILAVIPARSASRGLPGKNIKPLAGLPLLVHSILFAQRCPKIDRCIVSTDDPGYAELAQSYGAATPFLRPPELAADDTPLPLVLKHALEQMETLDGRTYASVLLLDPTSPGRLPEHLDAAIEMLAASPDADGVVACSKPRFNPFFVGVVEREGYLAPLLDGSAFTRRQDVPRFLRINGSLYLWRRSFVQQGLSSWVSKSRMRLLETPDEYAFSIDDAHEFAVADFVFGSGLVRLPWLGDKR